MDQQQFRIPRQTDLSLILALKEIRNGFQDSANLVIHVCPHYGAAQIEVPDSEPENSKSISYILSENSEVMQQFYLYDSARGRRVALSINRQSAEITDLATVSWNEWGQHLPEGNRSQLYVRLTALARKHLRVVDTEASLSGLGDNEWSRYRDSQQAVLNSLNETQKAVVVDFSRRSIEAEAAARAKYETLESELRGKHKDLEEQLAAEHAARLKAVEEREAGLKKREESFNTKEARYVARQEQQSQIEQIEKWINGWSFTKGTKDKRWPVVIAYIVATVLTGAGTVWFSIQTLEILKGKDFAQVAWWQWTLLSLKSILPFAAFTTFIVYFIRWTSSWARQHAEEEVRNRTRVVDLRRSSWLLEAVRDAQDNQRELPAELLKQLSQNLFSQGHISDVGDVHPQAVTEVLMQGLESIRVKSADGAEVEAKRNNSK